MTTEAKSPHPDLVLDKEAMKLLPDERKGTPLWTMRKAVKPVPIFPDHVEKKAHFGTHSRTCPWHGVVEVLDRNCPAKSLTATEGLSCTCVLMVSRIAGGRKPGTSGFFAKDFLHRGWLFTFKRR